MQTKKLRAIFCRAPRNPDLVDAVHRFRKSLFVDRYGWALPVVGDREVDQFDTDQTVHAAIFGQGGVRATFRALRTDRPYLAKDVFPTLAVVGPYPERADVWEISRFGVQPGDDAQALARLNYALMFWFARQVGASSLVALADLTYERFLRTLSIRTRRYGPPRTIGSDARGRELLAVAGEIPLAAQDPERLAALASLLTPVEITDAAEIFGPVRVSA